MTVSFLWLFLTVPWVGRQCVIAVLPDHTNLLFLVKKFAEQSGSLVELTKDKL